MRGFIENNKELIEQIRTPRSRQAILTLRLTIRKKWGCKINVGVNKGMTWQLDDRQLTKQMYEKAFAAEPGKFDMYWSKASVQMKRKACRVYLKLVHCSN